MTMISAQWAEALEPGIREWFFVGFNRRQTMIPMMYNIQNSAKAEEHIHGYGAIGTDAWEHFENAGVVPSVDFKAGYKTTFTNKEFVVDLPIRASLIEDNLYSSVLQPAQRLGDSASLKREVDAASVFNNAFSSSYTGGDGVSLCNDSHPDGPGKSGTQDNAGTLALTLANVETVRQAMMNFTDDTGNIVGVMPNLMLVPPELENEAKIITESQLKPGSMDNDLNPQGNRFAYAVWHYLTDSNNWFMIDTNLMMQSLFWFNRVPLDIILETSKSTSTVATYNARMRYSYGWADWRWVYGNAVT